MLQIEFFEAFEAFQKMMILSAKLRVDLGTKALASATTLPAKAPCSAVGGKPVGCNACDMGGHGRWAKSMDKSVKR